MQYSTWPRTIPHLSPEKATHRRHIPKRPSSLLTSLASRDATYSSSASSRRGHHEPPIWLTTSSPHALSTVCVCVSSISTPQPSRSSLLVSKSDLASSALRIPRTKSPHAQANFRLLIRHTFRTQALAVSPKQVAAVEHLLRKAKRTVEMWEAPSVRDVSVSGVMRDARVGHTQA